MSEELEKENKELKARIKFIEEHNKFYLNQVADLHKMIDDVRQEVIDARKG